MSLDERSVRLEKARRLSESGRAPFAVEPDRSHTTAAAREAFEALAAQATPVTLAGRLLTIRVHGGMMFADLADETGKFQLACKEDELGEAFSTFRDQLDPGDIIEAQGVCFLTRRGEQSLQVQTWRILTKALLPLPEKWHGLQDIETRYRQRELDLLSNEDVRERFRVRSRVVTALRRFLDGEQFMEVETPILHPIAGGANARPFVTHHHALDAQFYLRIAPELYLKRLLVGGFERVYEIGRCFRNEGIDPTHNPEFTMLELYQAYTRREPFLQMLEAMVGYMVREALGTTEIVSKEGVNLSFAGPFPQKTFRETIIEAVDLDIDAYPTQEALVNEVRARGLALDFAGCFSYSDCLDVLYKKTGRVAIVQPTWVVDYPAGMKPLANVSLSDPTKSACAQLVVCGAEVINAYYYELHDPLLQRERLIEQERLASEGSEEAQRLDELFLESLEHGMPPASGMGMGIDRFVSLITGAGTLKEVLLFPTLRPQV